MKKLFLLLLLIVAIKTQAQFTVSAYPLNESDSTFDITEHYVLQYNIVHNYNLFCLDTLQVFSNATGLYMRNQITWPAGSSNQVPPGSSPELRPRNLVNQHYNAGNWDNNIKNEQYRFTGYCFDSVSSSYQWTGSSWAMNIGRKPSASTFGSNGPVTVNIQNYDNGSGSWFPYTNNTYYYDVNNKLRSRHYRQYSLPTGSTYVDYIDSSYYYDTYSGFCSYALDTYVIYQKVGASYQPYIKAKILHYPNGSYTNYAFNWNTTTSTYDSMMITTKFFDRNGNDSIYIYWNWSNALQRMKISGHDVYDNTYDGSNNLILQERWSNYQIANKDSLRRYIKKSFSNYMNCNSSVSVQQIVDENDFSVYPNPSDGEVQLNFGNEISNGTIRILDVTGKTIYSTDIENSSMKLNLNILPGLYFVQFINDHQQIIKKLLIE